MRLNGAARGLDIEFHASTEKIRRIENTQNQIGIGCRGQRAASAVTSRARIGARALGADA